MVRRKIKPASTDKLNQGGMHEHEWKINILGFKNKMSQTNANQQKSGKKSPMRLPVKATEHPLKADLPHAKEGSNNEKGCFERFDGVLTEAVQKSRQNPGQSVKKVSSNAKILQEIHYYQKSVQNVISRAAFGRICREYFLQFGGPEIRVALAAIECLQESTEMYAVQLLEDSYLCTLHAKRTTLFAKDIRLARRLGGRQGIYL